MSSGGTSARVARAAAMVAEQLGCSTEHAVEVMAELAVATDTTLDEVATLVIDRDIRFD